MINMSITTPFTLVLPEHLQEDIVNRLEDAAHIARAKCVCKSLRDVTDYVRSIRIICKEEYHASVRNEIPTIVIPRVDGKSKASTSKAVIGGAATGRDPQAATAISRATQPHEADHQVGSIPLHDTPNSSAITGGSVVCFPQEEEERQRHHEIGSSSSSSSNGNSQEKGSLEVRRDRDVSLHAGRRVPPLGIFNGKRETLSEEAEIVCDHQEQRRDGCSGGNFFPNGSSSSSSRSSSSKKPRLQEGLSLNGELDPVEAREEASLLERKKDPDYTQKRRQFILQKLSLRDDDNNRGSFPNSQSSKKHKFEGEFHPVIEERPPQIAAAAAGGETTAITSSGASSNNNKVEPIFFRHLVPEILRKTKCIVRLWIEIDSKLQSKKVPDGERVFTDHWLTDPLKVNKWIPFVQTTLQDLCIVDYGQQAISRPSSLLAILSQTCKSVLFRHSCTLGSLVVHNQLQIVMESHRVLSFFPFFLCQNFTKRYSQIS
jgi:hypothetical protein